MKRCIACHFFKPLDEFHLHKGMKDGRLNKCKVCCSAYDRNKRAQFPGGATSERRARYERELETGARTRKGPQKYGRDLDARRRASLKHSHKRNARLKAATEFDEFVIDEAILLRQQREKITGGKWTVDHRIPLNHKTVCGLHVGVNLQVVPASWNYRKSNTNMADFWPLGY